MKLAALMINYRTAALTRRSVSALLEELAPFEGARVVVIDNDSRDGSVEALRAAAREEGWGARVEIVAAPRNGGYGYGINLGVAHVLAGGARPDYFFIINSDARPAPGALPRLVAFLDASPAVGVAGSEVRGEDGELQAAAFRFPSAWSEFEDNIKFGLASRLLSKHVVSLPTPPADTEVDWIPGASMLVRRQVFEAGCYFDEGFFLYFEEIDFCRRAKRLGYQTYFVKDAPILHVGSASTKLDDELRRMPGYWFESRHRYFVKHHGRAYTALSDLAWVTGLLCGRAKRALLRRTQAERPRFVRDFLVHTARDLLSAAPAPAADDVKVEPKRPAAAYTGVPLPLPLPARRRTAAS